MEHFYASTKVFAYLQEKGIGACGTCLHNRLHLSDAMKNNIDYPQYRALGKVFAHQGAVKKVAETPIKNSKKT